MPQVISPLDTEHVFVADWRERTGVRSFATLEEEDPVVAIATHPAALRAFPSRPPSGRPANRSHPSAAGRRLRPAVAILAVAAAGTLLGAGSLAGAEQATEPRPPEPAVQGPPAAASHVVQPGDTLWTLARRLQPEGDVRPLVARLRAATGGGALAPGQRIPLAV